MIKLKNYSLYKHKNKRIILHKKLIMTFYMTFVTLSKILKPENLQSSLYGQLFFCSKKLFVICFKVLSFFGCCCLFFRTILYFWKHFLYLWFFPFYIFCSSHYILLYYLYIFFIIFSGESWWRVREKMNFMIPSSS